MHINPLSDNFFKENYFVRQQVSLSALGCQLHWKRRFCDLEFSVTATPVCNWVENCILDVVNQSVLVWSLLRWRFSNRDKKLLLQNVFLYQPCEVVLNIWYDLMFQIRIRVFFNLFCLLNISVYSSGIGFAGECYQPRTVFFKSFANLGRLFSKLVNWPRFVLIKKRWSLIFLDGWFVATQNELLHPWLERAFF